MKIRINEKDVEIDGQHLPRLLDMIELVRSYIDPDHMITEIVIDGKPIKEEQWGAAPASFINSIIEFTTDLPRNYVCERLAEAPEIAQALYFKFRDSRKTFSIGDSCSGNEKLAIAARTLHDFLHWYHTIVQLVEGDDRERFSIEGFIKDLTSISEILSKHQLYQSWWAIGETIQRQLEPKLEELEDFLRKTAWDVSRAA